MKRVNQILYRLIRMKPLEELSKLAQEAKALRYPNVPKASIPKTKYSQKGANAITKAVLDFLSLKGHYASRIQSQGQFNPTLNRWTKSTVRRGIGDVLATVNGRTLMIEVKFNRDKMSPWQIKTKEDLEASGGVYWEVKSFDDFHEKYNSLIQNNRP